MGGSHESRINRGLREIASKFDGLIADEQLCELGLSRHSIETRVNTGKLIRIFRLVYVLPGTRLGTRGRWRAAVMSAGAGGCLSRGSALALHGLVRDPQLVHVVSLSGACRIGGTRFKSAAGLSLEVEFHQTRKLPESHLCEVDGIRATSVERSLLDFAATASGPELVKALSQGEKERKVHWDVLRRIAGSARGHRGAANLRREVSGWDPAFAEARSDPEIDFLLMLRRHRLAMPDVNVAIDRFVADFYWPDLRLVVELDPWGTHRGRQAFERDHRKSVELEAMGLRVIRFTWEDLYRHEDRTVRELKAIMRVHGGLTAGPRGSRTPVANR